MIVLHTKSIFVVRTFLLSWYDTICQVRMLYRDSVNKPPAGSLGNGSFFKYCMIMYKVHARHCFFDCMEMPSNAGTKILEKQGATEFPLPPGQEAMCPCDWAEKIFGLTRLAADLSELAILFGLVRGHVQRLMLLQRAELLCFTKPGLCQQSSRG